MGCQLLSVNFQFQGINAEKTRDVPITKAPQASQQSQDTE